RRGRPGRRRPSRGDRPHRPRPPEPHNAGVNGADFGLSLYSIVKNEALRGAAMSLKLNSLKAGDLDEYTDETPDEFCNTGLTTRDQNHCAHFVCHALDFNMRTPLCGDLKYSTRHKGVTMRVNDIFNYCTVRGYIDDAATIPQAV